ncbi:hypothetical protein BAUCODRAFT_36825 [Baudoinia panamericana UAMH 10762]|uniref:Uncharacterized protein n=1 Tax=Baudoinia panamericana (strain UAMH 10762) TaxID=717646 RepID=M2N383_BAUPA|nr:uncharacterized protein BAUCODRAFT_36825 [Baudoinia panamericana UAMH 10762]EMC93160.1 hypothetical protein BAUCODRAFT_36825 [Baudoinia panamericana UAMH 10762]
MYLKVVIWGSASYLKQGTHGQCVKGGFSVLAESDNLLLVTSKTNIGAILPLSEGARPMRDSR